MKTAVVLMNLGGPDNAETVRPFLFNLFADPAILRVPGFVRLPLAWLISTRRYKGAINNYAKMGGGSPLLSNTKAQADALQAALAAEGGDAYRCFIAMRYWHPMSAETALAVKDWGAERVVLLSLYPQWSTTTTASSFRAWQQAAKDAKLDAPTRLVCCYPTEPGFISAYAELARPALAEAAAHGRPRLLLSAHGVPENVIKDGDSYQSQCEASAAAIAAALGPDVETVLCYQSRVGPLKWIGPATEDEVRRAGADKRPLVVLPLAFVSDHIETIVEIGEEYAELAHESGVPHYVRVPAVGVHHSFIAGLARLTRAAAAAPTLLCPDGGQRVCADKWRRCSYNM